MIITGCLITTCIKIGASAHFDILNIPFLFLRYSLVYGFIFGCTSTDNYRMLLGNSLPGPKAQVKAYVTALDHMQYTQLADGLVQVGLFSMTSPLFF